jgi:hypothetical protein
MNDRDSIRRYLLVLPVPVFSRHQKLQSTRNMHIYTHQIGYRFADADPPAGLLKQALSVVLPRI